jgi:hypothetical protein
MISLNEDHLELIPDKIKKNHSKTGEKLKKDERMLYSSNIDSLTPTSTFNFLDTQTAGINIGDSVVGTIKLGQTTSSTSVHCSNIDLSSTNINNASLPAAGDLYLANNQTSGDLYIGTGARTAAGAISIGTGSSVANPITIGSATSVTNINGVGTIYANKFDTLSAGTDTTFLNSITSIYI